MSAVVQNQLASANAFEELAKLRRFESLLTQLSARFISLAPDEVEEHICHALRQVVEFLDVDRSSFGEFSADGQQLLAIESYAVEGVVPFPRVFANVEFPWFFEQVRRGIMLRFTRLPDQLPSEATLERAYNQQAGIKSLLMIPLAVGGRPTCAISFGSFRRYCEWPDALVQQLRVLGEVISAAMARKRAEAQIAAHREQLAHVARVAAMGELAAAIAHEVNQPLCAIASNAQTARGLLAHQNGDPSALDECLADIAADAQRASDVVARVRQMVKCQPIQSTSLDLEQVISEVLALVRSDFVDHGVTLTCETTKPLPHVLADRVQLQQVILNLLSNAKESLIPQTTEPRQVTVAVARDRSSFVRVNVRDTGIGLPREAEHIFEPFFTTRPNGMGMGLSIARSIVESHGGQIGAERNSDRGTTVWFTIPIDQGNAR
jgi:signal transduction histidine kinase